MFHKMQRYLKRIRIHHVIRLELGLLIKVKILIRALSLVKTPDTKETLTNSFLLLVTELFVVFY